MQLPNVVGEPCIVVFAYGLYIHELSGEYAQSILPIEFVPYIFTFISDWLMPET